MCCARGVQVGLGSGGLTSLIQEGNVRSVGSGTGAESYESPYDSDWRTLEVELLSCHGEKSGDCHEGCVARLRCLSLATG